MQHFTIHPRDIAELATPVAIHGAIGSGDTIGVDPVFDVIAGVVAVVVATRP